MSLVAALWPIFKPFAWLMILPAVAAILGSPQVKGWLGEQRVRRLIRSRLDPEVYREFFNVTVRTERGTTQIDHIYVSPFGVFVIETKNMGHWIYGGAQQPQWRQVHFKLKKAFPNPVWQNYGHVKALESLLGLPEDHFHSVVAFVGDSTFKTEMPAEVCTCSNLVEYIRSFDTHVFSAEQVAEICRKLEAVRLAPTLRTQREHVDSLRRRHGVDPVLGNSPARAAAEAFVEVAAERLLSAAEHRTRSGGRRYASRAVEATLGAMAFKALLALLTIFLIWWAFSSAVNGIAQSIPRRTPAAAQVRPAPAPVPVRNPAGRASGPAPARQPPPPVYYHPGGEDVADQQQADEAMRVLAPNTPEIPLVLPGSPP